MTTALAIQEDAHTPAKASAANSLMEIISRAASDPAFDVEKVRQLLDMRAQLDAKEREQHFDEAMLRVQQQIRAVVADKSNQNTRSRYASYFALDEELRPVYTKNGFALSFDTAAGAPEHFVRVTCRATCGGHSRIYHVDVPADGKGAKGGDVMTKTHAVQAAVTYGSRILLKMIFNVVIQDSDAGGVSNASKFITSEQVACLFQLLAETGGDVDKFCEYVGVANLGHVHANRYAAAVAAIERAAAARKAKEPPSEAATS